MINSWRFMLVLLGFGLREGQCHGEGGFSLYGGCSYKALRARWVVLNTEVLAILTRDQNLTQLECGGVGQSGDARGESGNDGCSEELHLEQDEVGFGGVWFAMVIGEYKHL